jgi:hypothetical protein
MSSGLPGSKLLTVKICTGRPGLRRLALASKGRESKLLFHQRNKKVVVARTQDHPAHDHLAFSPRRYKPAKWSLLGSPTVEDY